MYQPTLSPAKYANGFNLFSVYVVTGSIRKWQIPTPKWWKHLPRYWHFVRGIHRSPVNSPHKGQWSWALMFSLICTWINGWVNNGEAAYLRRHLAHYDVIAMDGMLGSTICQMGTVMSSLTIEAAVVESWHFIGLKYLRNTPKQVHSLTINKPTLSIMFLNVSK